MVAVVGGIDAAEARPVAGNRFQAAVRTDLCATVHAAGPARARDQIGARSGVRHGRIGSVRLGNGNEAGAGAPRHEGRDADDDCPASDPEREPRRADLHMARDVIRIAGNGAPVSTRQGGQPQGRFGRAAGRSGTASGAAVGATCAGGGSARSLADVLKSSRMLPESAVASAIPTIAVHSRATEV